MRDLTKDWLKKLEKRYSGKQLQPTEAHSRRVELEKKYGDKIVINSLEEMETEEEKLAKVEYDALTKELQRISPKMKEADENYIKAVKFEKYGKALFTGIKNNIWFIVGILLVLAIIKYLLS